MRQASNHVRFFLSVLLSVFLLFPLAGCWSSHEIEERSLGVGMALDKANKSMTEKEFDEQIWQNPEITSIRKVNFPFKSHKMLCTFAPSNPPSNT